MPPYRTVSEIERGFREIAKGGEMALHLASTAFGPGDMIPAKHTCDGENVSPRLTWLGAPGTTGSLAIVLEDIDSVKGVWSHWVLYDIPPSVNGLPEGIPSAPSFAWGGVQGRNDFDELGYGGPCPSDGRTHRYVIHLYALKERLELAPGATREEVLAAIKQHRIDEAELMGRYRRLADR